MHKEIEIKAKINDLGSLRKILLSVGKLQRKVIQKDTYYSPKENDFYIQKSVTKFLRIREEDNNNKITYHLYEKIGREDVHAKEFEVGIDSVETMHQIFEQLGFVKRYVVQKRREYINCGDFEVALDEVAGLGNFVEVEVKNPTKNLLVNDCRLFLESLHISFTGETQKSYLELLQEKEASSKK